MFGSVPFWRQLRIVRNAGDQAQKLTLARTPTTLTDFASGLAPGRPIHWKSGDTSNCGEMR